ncbi:WavE lipopolysaccharide synthesis family protein [Brachyspira intermedia]|uniref:WavE lipopolysaccharide synthesis family protein n=1 Tax=Brachyspira intermedia TaxID=84377 RepID=UPI0030049C9A
MIINSVDTKDISVVVQGAIDQKYTNDCLKSIRKYLPDSEIILSTWKDSNVDGLDYDILLLNEDPGGFPMSEFEINNVKRQILSTKNGINKSNNKYILKIRSDIELTNNRFIKFYSKYKKYNTKFKFVNERILVSSLATRDPYYWETPFCISDWITFGSKSDSLLLWDIPFPTNEDENWFNIHPRNINTLLGYNILVARFNPEQHIIVSFIRKFIKDIHFEHMFDYNPKSVELNLNILINNFLVLSPKLFNFQLLKPMRKEGDWYHILTYKKWLHYYNLLLFNKKKFYIDFEKISYLKYFYTAKKRYYNIGYNLDKRKIHSLKYLSYSNILKKVYQNTNHLIYNYDIFVIYNDKHNFINLLQTLESIFIQTVKTCKITILSYKNINEEEKEVIFSLQEKYSNIEILYDIENINIISNYFRIINSGNILHPELFKFEVENLNKYNNIIFYEPIIFDNNLPYFTLSEDKTEILESDKVFNDYNCSDISLLILQKNIYNVFIKTNYYNQVNTLYDKLILFFNFLKEYKCQILKVAPKYIGIYNLNCKGNTL